MLVGVHYGNDFYVRTHSLPIGCRCHEVIEIRNPRAALADIDQDLVQSAALAFGSYLRIDFTIRLPVQFTGNEDVQVFLPIFKCQLVSWHFRAASSCCARRPAIARPGPVNILLLAD